MQENLVFAVAKHELCRFQLSHGLRCGSATVCLLVLQVRIPPVVWMSVSCECCVLSVIVLCDRPIPRPGEYFSVCVCACVCHVIRRNSNTLPPQWVGRRVQDEQKKCEFYYVGFKTQRVSSALQCNMYFQKSNDQYHDTYCILSFSRTQTTDIYCLTNRLRSYGLVRNKYIYVL